ncbi:MAG: indole-3-glycerol phosphate synthase TrpC [Bacteroidota bacterium]|nr:indole-3-glycerol phosphate synthase TrpC [Bacteroidota bacterium]
MIHEIIISTEKRLQRKKELAPVKLLESSIYFDSTCVSLSQYILRKDKTGIIAEFKRKSPSGGIINSYADVVSTTIGYMQSGACALSVLTEPDYFQGSPEDLTKVRDTNYCPILRKDFIVDEYQIIESKSIGADAILLIAACLDKVQIELLHSLARSLGMEVIIEIHDQTELTLLPDGEYIIGVNNRNLKTMLTDIEHSLRLANALPQDHIRISESGLKSPKDIQVLNDAGYSGFLMGELFMKSPDPSAALADFIAQLKLVAI